MSDAGPPVKDPVGSSAAPQPAAAKPGMMADPVVRLMAFGAIGLVIIFLAVIIGVLLSGVTSPTGPRTLSEKELTVAGDAVRKGTTDPTVWGAYIAALIANQRYSQAESTIKNARASIDDSATAEFSLAEARLAVAQKDYKQAITIADKGQKEIETVQAAIIAAGGLKASRAKLDGLHENWYILTLLKVEAYRGMGDWANAIKQMDIYITKNPTAADILIDRGTAKIEVKDNAGAEKDFKAALKFMPDDPEALAGLQKIGASTK